MTTTVVVRRLLANPFVKPPFKEEPASTESLLRKDPVSNLAGRIDDFRKFGFRRLVSLAGYT